jgi:putative ABC transport system permease protein
MLDTFWKDLKHSLRMFWNSKAFTFTAIAALALGAEARQVKNMVVFQGMRLAIAGLVIGLAGAFGLTRLIEAFLYGVKPWDPTTFVGVPLVLAAVALLAVWVPAHRASRVDPIHALRYE